MEDVLQGEHVLEASGRSRVWSAYCVAVASILIVAAGMKAWNAPKMLATDGLLADEWLLPMAIAIEAGVAVLIVGLSPRLARILIVGLFGCFAVVATYSLLSGTECNCFGGDWFGARFTLPMDVCVLFGAWLLAPKANKQEKSSRLIPSTTLGLSALAMAVGVGVFEYRKAYSKFSEKLEYLLADELVGKPWPITEVYHPDLAELRVGKWLILILRPDCEHCRELVEDHFQDPNWHPPGMRTAVFLAGSNRWTFNLDHVSLVPDENSIHWEDGEPFVASPALFQCVEGIIGNASDGVSSEAFRSSLPIGI